MHVKKKSQLPFQVFKTLFKCNLILSFNIQLILNGRHKCFNFKKLIKSNLLNEDFCQVHDLPGTILIQMYFTQYK